MRRLAERDAGYSLKGVKFPPPRGRTSYSLLRSPGFRKPGANQGLDTPALLTAMDTPQTFGVVGDLSVGRAEGVPLLSIMHFSLPPVFDFGVPNPLFFGGFSPRAPFSEAGWDTYPTSEKKGAHRGDSGFYCFTVGVVSVLQVYFQLQTEKSIVPQRFSGFRFSTAEDAEQYHCYTPVTAL